MGINLPRLVLSGLVAGFIINLGELAVNVWLLGDRWAEAMTAFGVDMDFPSLVLWGAGSFILGIVGVWIYVAIRPRYSAGPRTALRAALAIWCATYLWVGIGMLGVSSVSNLLVLVAVLWGLVEMALGVYVGSWLYREGELGAT